MSATEVLARLARASTARVEVSAGTGVSGTGAGTVGATREGEVVVLAEVGEWAPAGGRAMRWRASSRWRAEGGALAVEHVRQGTPARAVLDLVDGAWVGREPHICGHDQYACTLTPEGEALAVAWTISGPCKAARVVTRYAG
ncbi:DUF6314 family protein [Rubrivirga sp. IMCC43871]|uniref:DUF6314 family protein n=1 Tax=Rubrivirga sp. IMCC43871 TaxID=3391575 RepID=UPI00398FAF40